VTVLKNVPEGVDLNLLYTELGGCLGTLALLDENPITGIRTAQAWTQIKYNEPKRKKAYKYSDKHHPLHTDYTYVDGINLDMTFFYCLQQAGFGGATFFLNPFVLESALKQYDPNLLHNLCTKDVLFSRKGTENQFEKKMKVIEFDDIGMLINWNYFRATDNSDTSTKEMIESFHLFLEQRVLLGGLVTPYLLQKGEGVFIHDRRVLHGRHAFIGDRHLNKGAITLS
jgi:alpha-ketoglutarate-dependent taurine dioxygenase